MTRIGLLGAGSHSSGNHGPSLQRCRAERPDEITLAAVCDLDEEKGKKYAERFGFERSYTDLEEMVAAERLDGIVAVTPIAVTEAVAGKIARLGLPLVIEKPLGPDLATAERLREGVVATGVPHMISFNRRFSPAFTRAVDWLADRARPELVISRMLRHNRREGEFVFGTGIHSIDNVLALMGRPMRVSGWIYEVSGRKTPFFDGRVAFADGGAALFAIAPASGRVEESMEIIGDGYDVQIDVGGCGIRIFDRGELVLEWRAEEGMEEWERNGTLDEMRAFIGMLEKREGRYPGLEEGVWSTRTADAIQKGGETVLDG